MTSRTRDPQPICGWSWQQLRISPLDLDDEVRREVEGGAALHIIAVVLASAVQAQSLDEETYVSVHAPGKNMEVIGLRRDDGRLIVEALANCIRKGCAPEATVADIHLDSASVLPNEPRESRPEAKSRGRLFALIRNRAASLELTIGVKTFASAPALSQRLADVVRRALASGLLPLGLTAPSDGISSGSDRRYPAPEANSESLASVLRCALVQGGGRTVLLDAVGGTTWSYAELLHEAQRVEVMLRERVAERQIVAVAMPRSFEFVAAFLGCLLAQRVCLTLEPSEPLARLQGALRSQRAAALLTHSALDLPIGEQKAESSGKVRFRHISRSERHTAAADEDVPALIFATSGSTGTPKGVLLGEQSCLSGMKFARDIFSFGPSDRHVFKTSTNFVSVLRQVVWPVFSGGSMVLVPPAAERDLQHIMRITDSCAATVTTFIPGALKSALRLLGDAQVSTVRAILAGGEYISADLQRETFQAFPNAEFYNIYACTEAPLVSIWNCPRGDPRAAAVGTAVPSVDVTLVNRDGKLVPPGHVGEIVLSGPGIALGYVGDAVTEDEKQRFSHEAPLHAGRAERCFRSGDLARLREDSVLEFVARSPYIVKVRGYRIDIGEIEKVMEGICGVQQAVVSQVTTSRGEKLVASIVLESPSEGDEWLRFIERSVRALLPAYMVPLIRKISAVPLTANGKVDRREMVNAAARYLEERRLGV